MAKARATFVGVHVALERWPVSRFDAQQHEAGAVGLTQNARAFGNLVLCLHRARGLDAGALQEAP